VDPLADPLLLRKSGSARNRTVASTTDPYGRILLFTKLEPLLSLPISSLIVFTRLSGPPCRPTTSQKIW
jgi:hypothetical protein